MQSPTHARNFHELCSRFSGIDPIWVVDLPRQRILRFPADGRVVSAPVSTARLGLGNRPGSGWTPLGLHRVAEVIGRNATPGQRFESRRPVGTPLPPSAWRHGTGDAITSRILRLDGLEPGLNGHSHRRCIYLHGTHREDLLGTPASHGCIRMANRTLIEWVDTFPDTAPPHLWIGCLEEPPLATSAS